MGTIDRRLEALEAAFVVSQDEFREAVRREFLRRLTFEEKQWLAEPADQAQGLVACPRFEPRECGCRCIARVERGYAEHPELYDEKRRRWESLLERREEIMAREPTDRRDELRRRHGFSA